MTTVLVVNAGSSSLKLALLDDRDVLLERTQLPADASGVDASALTDVFRAWPRPDVVGHRVVHGGTEFSSAVRITPSVERRLRDLTDLAPLHQPKSLIGLVAVREQLPGVAEIACFDTAFHTSMGTAAATYAVPREWRERWGVRRYGFHGLSHAYCARRAPVVAGRRPAGLRVVTCHLGAGASLAAVVDGRCVDTTMGFTPLEGLVMATRSGTVDPGLVLWLEEHEKLQPREVAQALEERSGMLALAGTADQREIEARAAAGDDDARLALEVYLHRLVIGIGAMAAAAGGLDVLAFTGGVGEHSSLVRQRAAQRLGWLGVAVDDGRNAAVAGDADISAPNATAATVVVSAREDLQITDEVLRLLGKR